MGTTTPDGTWSSNKKLWGESTSYPKRLGKALLASWMHSSTAINISWSKTTLGLVWVDPHFGRTRGFTEWSHRLPTVGSPPKKKKRGVESGGQGVQDLGLWSISAVESGGQEVQELEPQSVSTRQPDTVESGSQGEQDLGPWSTAESGSPEVQDLGPWSRLPNTTESGSQEVQDLGPWPRRPNIVESGSHRVQDLGPWSATFPKGASSISSPSTIRDQLRHQSLRTQTGSGHTHPHSALGAMQHCQALLGRT